MQFNRIFRLTAGAEGSISSKPMYSAGTVPGTIQQGNVDLANRPRVQNADGSISTVQSLSVELDGKFVLLPGVGMDGRILSDDEAIEVYERTGKHLGIFATEEAADKYAALLHAQQEQMYASGNRAGGVVIESTGIGDSLRIVFDIDKDLTQQTNKSSVKIYNLSEATRKKLEVADAVCLLEVGYAEDVGLRRIFLGEITYATTRRNGPDKETEIELNDGQVAMRNTIVSLGYAAGVGGRKIVDDVAGQMGLLTQIAADVEWATYPAGFSFVGKGTACLEKVMDATGATWSIQNNVLQVIMAGGSTNVQALVLSPSTGLIGSPERIVRGVTRPDEEAKKKRKVKKDKKKKQAGWKVRSLLAPTVNPGDLIRVESSTVTGWFREESVKHTGDTHGQEWYTEHELIEVELDEP